MLTNIIIYPPSCVYWDMFIRCIVVVVVVVVIVNKSLWMILFVRSFFLKRSISFVPSFPILDWFLLHFLAFIHFFLFFVYCCCSFFNFMHGCHLKFHHLILSIHQKELTLSKKSGWSSPKRNADTHTRTQKWTTNNSQRLEKINPLN